MFRIRNVLQEFEAHLTSVEQEFAKVRGKSEWKKYGDGAHQLKISLTGLNLREGTALVLTVDGVKIGDMIVQGKTARFKRESEKGEFVPAVEAEQTLRVIFLEKVIVQGKYVAE